MCIPLSHSLYLYVSVEKRGGCSDCEYAIQCATGKDCTGVARARERAEGLSGGAGRPAQRTILRGTGSCSRSGCGSVAQGHSGCAFDYIMVPSDSAQATRYTQAEYAYYMHSVPGACMHIRILFHADGPHPSNRAADGPGTARAPQHEFAATSRGAELSLERHVLPARMHTSTCMKYECMNL